MVTPKATVSPTSDPSSPGPDPARKPGDWEERIQRHLDDLEPWAALARTALQMLVGVLLVVRLV